MENLEPLTIGPAQQGNAVMGAVALMLLGVVISLLPHELMTVTELVEPGAQPWAHGKGERPDSKALPYWWPCGTASAQLVQRDGSHLPP